MKSRPDRNVRPTFFRDSAVPGGTDISVCALFNRLRAPISDLSPSLHHAVNLKRLPSHTRLSRNISLRDEWEQFVLFRISVRDFVVAMLLEIGVDCVGDIAGLFGLMLFDGDQTLKISFRGQDSVFDIQSLFNGRD